MPINRFTNDWIHGQPASKCLNVSPVRPCHWSDDCKIYMNLKGRKLNVLIDAPQMCRSTKRPRVQHLRPSHKMERRWFQKGLSLFMILQFPRLSKYMIQVHCTYNSSPVLISCRCIYMYICKDTAMSMFHNMHVFSPC